MNNSDNEIKPILVNSLTPIESQNLRNKISELEAENKSLCTALKDLMNSKDSIKNLLEEINDDNLDLKIKIYDQQAEINKLRASLKEAKK